MQRVLFLVLACVVAGRGAEAVSAASVSASLHKAGLDASQCFRVRDLTIQRDELKIYLTEGRLIFSHPVNGRTFAAVFTSDIPGGDAELLLMPPHRSERLSLSSFANAPNLNEHFGSALFLFTGNTGQELLAAVSSAPNVRKEPEAGLLLEDRFRDVLRNIVGSYEIRLVRDLLLPPEGDGFLYALLNGKTLGNIDLLYDPQGSQQITAGQIAYRENRPFFNVWTSFVSRSFRTGGRKPDVDDLKITDTQIDASIESNLHLKARTRLTIQAGPITGKVIPLEVARRMNITEAKLDGSPVEVFMKESFRSQLVKGTDNEPFLVVLPQALDPSRSHTLEIAHEGNVIFKSGSGVYFVTSRASWYPNRPGGFSKFDLTFRYPKTLDLVATGDVLDERTEGDQRIVHRSTSVPVRFAGFNLGVYDKAVAVKGGITVEVYANRVVEDALRTTPSDVLVVPSPRSAVRRFPEPAALPPITVSPPSPKARLEQLALEISSAMDFMATNLGPPPLKRLTVSPIPGTFGQGFPGLVYLSTLSYLNASDRPVRTESQQTFYSELLSAHETAHQWWGNLVVAQGNEDEWMMEALSNYTAMLLLERKKGRRALETVLDEYRDHLLSKTDSGKTLESQGPIVWGPRLVSSQAPNAWRTITYEKGTWILHMLRMRMGDEAFWKMMRELVRRRAYQPLTTEDLRLTAAELLPPHSEDSKLEGFFEQWVYGTGIPSLKLSYTVSGKAPAYQVRGTVAQSEVDDDFSAFVPVDLLLPTKKTITKWVRTSDDPVAFTIDLKSLPSKVQLDSSKAILKRR